jgi:hypothetical protein
MNDGLKLLAEIPLLPSEDGNFTVPHGLPSPPKLVIIRMTSGGAMWFQTPHFDSKNIYLVAAAPGVTGVAEILG